MSSIGKQLGFVQQLTMSGRLWLLSIAMLLSGVVLIGFGVFVFGTSLKTGVLALMVCWVSSALAHVGGEYPKGDYNFAARMAIQMVVRTLPPFGFALWGVKFANPPLETSLVFYILSFYLIGLVADVQLHVQRLKAEMAEREEINS